jgi:hypothetical protein
MIVVKPEPADDKPAPARLESGGRNSYVLTRLGNNRARVQRRERTTSPGNIGTPSGVKSHVRTRLPAPRRQGDPAPRPRTTGRYESRGQRHHRPHR